ncbi:RraA family protein [Campylobacter jejuni]|uniref:Putative 4-hydroxy-4-methyl-2-oxoglutarate aldolase n=2 Tax=Campylobacter jejuni TaxID=197 RepID=A0A430WHM0_CAMJU|nr:4-hydroxy-4-methyl-2-oxoglutarate aldolase [Campylobacter jejuni]EAK0249625.1 RraA family protein [Campylobacter jejuni]ECK2571434.1 RraA family protein [Campylobacter jejuni]ECQ7085655.1 RraA family protein [Campylobacter jejuni]ECR1497404.1 RraA family protein [Campylobacter jejuni]EDA5834365.1 RraA family protein [Campylobacter jejuni]
MFILKQRIQKCDEELMKLCQKVCPSTIGHMQDHGFIRNLKALHEGVKIVGNALTARIPHMDSTAVHKVFDLAKEGDIVVIDTNKDYERAPFGELVCYRAKTAKVGAVIVDGAITDFNAIKNLGVNVYYRQVSALTTRIKGIEGAINVPIAIDGVVVNPGDLILIDDDGILVLNPEFDDIKNLATRAIAIQEGEADIKAKMDKGMALSELLGANDYFKDAK